jgi:hypothetical protein
VAVAGIVKTPALLIGHMKDSKTTLLAEEFVIYELKIFWMFCANAKIPDSLGCIHPRKLLARIVQAGTPIPINSLACIGCPLEFASEIINQTFYQDVY